MENIVDWLLKLLALCLTVWGVKTYLNLKKENDLIAKEQQKFAMKAELIREITTHFNKNNFTKALDISIRLKYLTNLVGNIKLKIKHANNRD